MVLFLFVTWEQRKLGDVGKAQSGIGFPDREQGGKEGVPFYKVSDMNNYGNEHEMHSANNYVTEEQCRRNGWTPITEISVVFAKVGAAIMLNRKRLVRFSFLLDNNTMAYRFGSGWDINFGKTLFERVDLTELVQIGALPSYNATDVESVEISMPDKPEQYQIGEFFKQLDNLITLHQRKYDKIVNIKKALLEKMFPAEGEEVPKIRFKGFTEAWEQRKLGGEAEELLAGGDIDKDLICESGRYPVIANALTNDGIVGFYEKYYRVEAPAVTVSGRGDVGHAQARRVNFTPVVRLLSIKSRHNVDFLENAINRGEVIIESTGVPQLTVPQLSKRTISFPQTVQEEEKIGKLFFKIDNLITLHQRGLIKIQGDKKWQKRKFQKNCSAIILNAG